jgi:hypothetical protein
MEDSLVLCTHTAEQVVLQVEGNIALLLDHLEDLVAKGIRIFPPQARSHQIIISLTLIASAVTCYFALR